MKYLLALAAVLLPGLAFADCTGLTMTPCVDQEMQRTEQRVNSYGQHEFDPPSMPPIGSMTERHMPSRDVRPGLERDWTYLRTPNGSTYTNLGNGMVVGPDGLYVTY